MTGALLAGAAIPRYVPDEFRSRVWAQSRWAGEQPPTPLTRKIAGRLKAALEQHGKDTAPAEKSKRRGGKGTIGLYTEKIYAYLLDLAVRCRGEVYPSTATIAQKVGCSPRTVVKARGQLKVGGWLAWIHRCEPTGNQGQKGPQVRQLSNWYLLGVGEVAAKIFARWDARKAPIDADEAARRRTEAAFRSMCQDEDDAWAVRTPESALSAIAAELRRAVAERDGA